VRETPPSNTNITLTHQFHGRDAQRREVHDGKATLRGCPAVGRGPSAQHSLELGHTTTPPYPICEPCGRKRRTLAHTHHSTLWDGTLAWSEVATAVRPLVEGGMVCVWRAPRVVGSRTLRRTARSQRAFPPNQVCNVVCARSTLTDIHTQPTVECRAWWATRGGSGARELDAAPAPQPAKAASPAQPKQHSPQPSTRSSRINSTNRSFTTSHINPVTH
jgi:hypothetical protein